MKSQDIEVELIPIELHDFDLLLGMDWLSLYRAKVNCFAKTVTL
jgi:hypothetical protein